MKDDNLNDEEFDFLDDDFEVLDIDFSEIEKITEVSVKKRLSFAQSTRAIFKELRMKNVFHDKVELFFMGLVGTFSIMFSLILIFNNANLEYVYSPIFLISPIFYIVLSLFSFFNAREKGAIDIELTCKYNIHSLTAIRMFIFSIVAVLINTLLIFVMYLCNKDILVVRAVATSITALFLFSAILLFVIARIKKRYAKTGVIVFWIGANIILNMFMFKTYNEFLFKMPIYLHVIITVISIVVYVKSLKKYMGLRGRE
ncbi:MAG: hypothetical protein ACRC6T_08900 [Sarcina sp.]